ncbi:MAG: DUF1697 domain-containing protein [bacterium]
MTTFVALLRAVNVVGRRTVPMAELRALCEGLDFTDVKTHIQSGNLVFTAPGPAKAVQAQLEHAIRMRFKFDVPVIVRTAKQWTAYLAPPFPEAARDRPSLLLIGVGQRKPRAEAAAELGPRAQNGERVATQGDILWFDYPNGVGRSKLTPALIDKAAGTSVTARNWNTVRKLAELAGIAI